MTNEASIAKCDLFTRFDLTSCFFYVFFLDYFSLSDFYDDISSTVYMYSSSKTFSGENTV